MPGWFDLIQLARDAGLRPIGQTKQNDVNFSAAFKSTETDDTNKNGASETHSATFETPLNKEEKKDETLG